MQKITRLIVFITFLLIPANIVLGEEYFDNMLNAHQRGFTNIATGFLEISLGVVDAHGKGLVGINYIDGLLVGSAKAVVRTLSGVVDIVNGFIPIPELRADIPPNPETLF